MRDLVIIGQAPSRTGDPADPVVSARLAGLFGLSLARYKTIRRMNLLNVWPGKAGKGDAFPMPAARVAAEGLVGWLQGKRALLLGRGVARAFGLRSEYLRWHDHRGFRAAVFPHPSGINHYWNDAANRRRAAAFVRRAAKNGGRRWRRKSERRSS